MRQAVSLHPRMSASKVPSHLTRHCIPRALISISTCPCCATPRPLPGVMQLPPSLRARAPSWPLRGRRLSASVHARTRSRSLCRIRRSS
jgi:hypothetical protein